MDICETFSLLSIKHQSGSVFFSLNVKPPWIVIETIGSEYSVNDFIIIKKADNTEFIFRVLKIASTATRAVKFYIPQILSEFYGYKEGESVRSYRININTTSSVASINLSTRKGSSPSEEFLDSCRLHGLYFNNQLLSLNPYAKVVLAKKENEAIFIEKSCGVSLILDPTINDDVNNLDYIGGSSTWLVNTPRNEIYNCLLYFVNLNCKVIVLSHYHPSNIHKLIFKNRELKYTVVIDDIGYYRDERFFRLIVNYSFIIKEFEHICKNLDRENSSKNSIEKWDDIAGYKDLIKSIQNGIESLHQDSSLSDKIGISYPKGILLFGPPGCSKTMIARSISRSTRTEFISIKGPEIFSKWIGDSEKAIADIFKKAKRKAPCLIFFDEFDSIASSRSLQPKSTVESRVVSQLLSEMDGLSNMYKILIIAATNRPDIIDPALLRPGRFDLHFHVPLPDFVSRKEIIEMYTINTCVYDDVVNELDKLAGFSDGRSGAEIAAGCKKLIIDKIKGRDIKNLFNPSLFINQIGY